MALNVDLQVLVQPGATGNQTYSLPANFDPKAIILWAVPMTADGSQASYALGVGFGTDRGGSPSQYFKTMRGLDNATSADLANSAGTGALLRLLTQSAGSTAIDLEIDLDSMQTGTTSEVVLNWVNLHSTASIRVFMLVLGGSDIQDALVHTLEPTTSTTQDVTVVSGFGKPELIFFLGSKNVAEVADHNSFTFGFGKQGEAGRMVAFAQTHGNTNSLAAMSQRSDRAFCQISSGAGTVQMLGRLDTVTGNWPTDGFRLLFDAAPGGSDRGIGFLSIRTTAQIATGANTAPTSGGLPVVQDNAAGFAPKLGMLFGWNLAASAAVDTTGSDLAGFGIGGTDGTTEAWAGITEDDGLGTMDSNNQSADTKAIRNYNAAAALQSEADGSFSGNNFRLSWNDIDTIAREYQFLILGDAAGGGPVETPIAISAGLALTPTLTRVKTGVLAPAAGLTVTPAVAFPAIRPKAIVATLTNTPTLSRIKTALIAVAASLTNTPALEREPQRTLSTGLTVSPAISRKLFKTIAAGLTATPAFLFGKKALLTINAGLTLTPAITRRSTVARAISASLSLVPTLGRIKTAPRQISASTALTGAHNRRLFKPVAATLPLNPVLAFEKVSNVIPIALNAVLNLTPQIVRSRFQRIALEAQLFLLPHVSWKPVRTIVQILGAISEKPLILAATADEPRIIAATVEKPIIERVE